jgi:outer membrane protein assembly factor BamB
MNRRLSCFAAGLLMVATLVSPAGAAGHDWPGFLGPTGDGKSTESILLDWPAEGLPVLWFKGAGEGYSAPTVAGGRVFVFDRVGDEARLSAWDAATGKELWSTGYATAYEDLYRYSGGPRAAPVADGERVFAYGVEGRLRAHSVETGKVLWEVDTAARFGVVQNFFGVGSTPVVEGGLLLVQVGGSPAGSPPISSGEVKGSGSGIVAFDKATGAVRYSITDELAAYATIRVATVSGRRRAYAFTRGGLLSFEPAKGTVDFFYPWRANKLESVNASTPVVVGDTVFISESYGPGSSLLRVRPDGYEVVWKDPPKRGQSLRTHWSTPIFHDGYLYGSSGQSSGEAELRAVEHATGKVAWSVPGLGRSTLIFAGGHLLVLTETGKLLLVEANPERFVKLAEMDLGDRSSTDNEVAKTAVKGKKVDRPLLRFPAWNAPVLAHGRLYLRGKDQVICLDVAPRQPSVPAGKPSPS